ncbi:MAG: alpha-amylase [Bacteroidales bacterium]|nr:alpha-amylase [Bacteroidales bacterium]
MKKRISMFLVCLLVPVFALVVSGCKKDEPAGNINPPPEPPYEINNTPFDNVPATEDIVMYEVNFLAYSSTLDINGVTAKLDSFVNLGVNVIWLMPIHPIGEINSVNSPYSVQNYTEVNPDLGTLEDLRILVSKAHDRDMAVILDWVGNHTAWDNPWIENSDWYTQDEYGNIISPNPEWQDVADLNFDNEEMRLEMIKSMKYWITNANVDGFRCDAADFVPFDFWQQAIDSLENIPGRDLIFLAEGDRVNHLTAGFHLIWGWDLINSLRNIFAVRSASGVFETVEDEYTGVPEGKHRLYYITNHDVYAWEGTVVEYFNSPEGSVAAFVIAAFIRGVPLLYNGQEIANPTNIAFFGPNPLNWNQNPDIYADYLKIMTARKSLDAVTKGDLVSYDDDDIAAFKKVTDSQEVLVLVNVRNSNVTYTIPAELEGTTWENTIDNSDVTLSGNYSFSPYEYLILND